MATYYLQHGAYPAYVAAPSAAQDGDGLAMGLATWATASITFASNLGAVSGNTISVCGVTLTLGSTPADATALAAAIAALIQASSTAIPSGYPASNWTQPQLRNALYATSSGATLTVRTRAGSAVYNANPNWQISSATIAGFPTTQFAGGASGAWGYFVNDDTVGTMWPSALAKWTYSPLLSTQIAGPRPQGFGDTVNIRANGVTITHSAFATQFSFAIAASAFYVVDDGTIWAGDTGTFVWSLGQTAVGYGTTWGAASGVQVYFGARTLGKFIFQTTTGCGTQSFGHYVGGPGSNITNSMTLDRISFVDNSTNGSNPAIFVSSPYFNVASDLTFLNCSFTFNRTFFYPILSQQAVANNNTVTTFENCTFSWPSLSGASGGLANLANWSTATNYRVVFRNCTAQVQGSFSASNAPTLFTGLAAIAAGNALIAENCPGFNVNASGGLLGLNGQAFGHEEVGHILQQGVGPTRQYRFETPRTTIAWAPGAGYPTLTATLPDGTLFSYLALWAGSNLSLSSYAIHGLQGGVELARLTKTITSTGGLAGTVTVDLLMDAAIPVANVTDQHLGLKVSYVSAATNRTVMETTNARLFNRGAGSPLAAGSGAWTKSSYPTFNALKLALTLSGLPAANTEIEVAIVAYQGAPQSANASFFIHPDPTVT